MVKYYYEGKCKSKKPLKIDNKKALWLMRMIVGEGGKHCSRKKAETLLWAIVNRWFLWPGSRHYFTFVGLMRAFSQPINPRWMTGGDLARKCVNRDAGSKARLARRAKICGLKLKQIPRRIRIAVWDFQDGNIDFNFDSNISNWASLKSTPFKNPQGQDVEGDWFFADRNIKKGCVKRVRD